MGEMEDGVKKTMTLTIKELKDGYKKGYLEENGKLYSLHESPCFRTNDFKNLPDEDEIIGKKSILSRAFTFSFEKYFGEDPVPCIVAKLLLRIKLCSKEEIDLPCLGKNRTIVLSFKTLKKACDEKKLIVNNMVYTVFENSSFGSLPDNIRWKARWEGYYYIATTSGYDSLLNQTYISSPPYEPTHFEIFIYPPKNLILTKPAARHNTNNSGNSNIIISSSEEI